MIGYLLIMGVFAVIGGIVQNKLKKKFENYGQQSLQEGLSGKEVAEKMLADNGIEDVKITAGEGYLTDHYNPQKKTVTLSPDVYKGRNISAAAVAAHECGHAVQHAQGYAFLKFRSAIVPLVSFSNQAMQMVFFASLFMGMGGFFAWDGLLLFILICQGLITVFSLITLPVEFDASNRALAWLNEANITTPQEHEGTKDALKWAAMTYLVAALSALVTLLYFLMMFMGRE